jgi:WD40 repeat protein
MIAERVHQWKAHSAALYALSQGRCESALFSAGADRVVAEWELGKDEPNAFAIRVESTIYSLNHLPDGRLVVGCANGSMHVIDVGAKKEIRHLRFHDKGIFHLQYDEETARLYAASADGSVSVWNIEDWSLLWHLTMTHQKVRRIAISPNGALVAFALGDGRIALLETQSHKVIHEIDAHEESCNSIAFINDEVLISGGKDAFLKTWNIPNGCTANLAIPAHNFAIYDIIVHPEQHWIATASRDKTVKLWDMKLEEKPLRLDRSSSGGHINSVNGLFYQPASDILYSCSDDRSICAWRIKS